MLYYKNLKCLFMKINIINSNIRIEIFLIKINVLSTIINF